MDTAKAVAVLAGNGVGRRLRRLRPGHPADAPDDGSRRRPGRRDIPSQSCAGWRPPPCPSRAGWRCAPRPCRTPTSTTRSSSTPPWTPRPSSPKPTAPSSGVDHRAVALFGDGLADTAIALGRRGWSVDAQAGMTARPAGVPTGRVEQATSPPSARSGTTTALSGRAPRGRGRATVGPLHAGGAGRRRALPRRSRPWRRPLGSQRGGPHQGQADRRAQLVAPGEVDETQHLARVRVADGRAEHVQGCTTSQKCSAAVICTGRIRAMAVPGALVPAARSSHAAPSTKFMCSARRRNTGCPSTQSSRALASPTAIRCRASVAIRPSNSRNSGSSSTSGLRSRWLRSSAPSSCSGATVRPGSTPPSRHRRQESATTVRTPAASPECTKRSCARRSGADRAAGSGPGPRSGDALRMGEPFDRRELTVEAASRAPP